MRFFKIMALVVVMTACGGCAGSLPKPPPAELAWIPEESHDV